MKKLETLTKEQKQSIIPIRDEYLNYVLSCKNETNKKEVKDGVRWLYEYCGEKQPIVVFMSSPFGCQVAANLLKNNIRENIGDNIRGNIVDNIVDNIGANIGANIRANIGDNIRDNIGANIRANIVDNIGANIGDNIRDNIGANIRDNIGDNKFVYHEFGWRCGVFDLGWVGYIDFFIRHNLIKTGREDSFKKYKQLLLSGFFMSIQFGGACIVSDMPNFISRDLNNQLHNIDGFAIKFRDGWGQYYIHGVYIGYELFEKLTNKEYKFEDWAKEENEEVKSAILSFMAEKWGNEYLFRFISDNLKEVDTFVDKKDKKYLAGTTGGMNIGVYTLFKGMVGEVELAFVRCYCPSTDRMFFLGVDPTNNNAKDAIASLYRIPAKLKPHIKYIQRQGERFSTVFTDSGKKLLDTLPKSEIENLTHISGEEYFSKITYEY